MPSLHDALSARRLRLGGAGSLWKGETGLLFIGFGTAFLTEYLRRWRSESDIGFTRGLCGRLIVGGSGTSIL